MSLWNLNTHKWLLENRHSPWKNTCARAHIWLVTKQNRRTYTKSQDMKRFIIDAIIHCNWTRIRTNSLRFTFDCVSDYNRKLQEEICKRKVVVVSIFKVSSNVYLKIQNGRKSKTKIVCKYMIKITKFSKKYNTTETLLANIRKKKK